MLFCRAALPLSRKTLTSVAGLIRRHRVLTGSCWRKLNPGQQALLVPGLSGPGAFPSAIWDAFARPPPNRASAGSSRPPDSPTLPPALGPTPPGMPEPP